MMEMLSEGLRLGDLANLVSPLISIDEYTSKISDAAIVIGFAVSDLPPAKDLNRFIQKSHIEILDTDVSPAPDPNGDYVVFVEIPRTSKSAHTIVELCDSLRGITGNLKWDASLYNHKKHIQVGDELIKAMAEKPAIDPTQE